jgi:hypothetical protein
MDTNDELSRVLNRIKKLQEWEVVVKVPEDFQFYGVVPYDINITNGIAFVKVIAATLEEATMKAKNYFNGPQEEDPT